MIKIGFVTTSLTDGNASRGVGFYTKHLLSALKTHSADHDIEILEVSGTSDLSGNAFDLIHYPYFDLFSPSLPLLSSIKTIVTIHDVVPLELPHAYPPGIKGTINLLRQKLSLVSVSQVLTDSYASVVGIKRHLSVPDEKIKLIYLAASTNYKRITDSKLLSTVAKKYGLPKKYILYVGDINYNKNIPSLIHTSKALDIPLVMVGKSAAMLETLDFNHPELVHLKTVDFSSIIRPGFVPDTELAAIYSQATVYCLPSFAEGFGLSILEAMACGCPVVCSSSHSLPEVGGEAAIYFDPYNQQDMQSKISQVLSSALLRSQLAKKGIIQSANFSWAKTAQQTLAVYKNLCR